MHVRDIFDRDSTTLSFEFFPPGSDTAWETLFQKISDFESLRPSFVSVTYGAAGTTRQRTHELVARLRSETTLDPVPHLTAIAHSRAEINSILAQYAESGVNSIMALRGDPPSSHPDYDRTNDDFKFAIDLVRAIREFKDHPSPGGFGIGVAGFPEGHPATPNHLVHMDHLKAKVDAGADYVCTQMFFDNRAFYDWCERCDLAGINVPLIAGIMPILSIRNLKRMSELAAGTNFPAPLLRSIYRCQDDPEAVERVGIHWATEQCRDLLDRGVRGIHFYTLNRSDATKRIYQTLGVRDSAGLR